MADKKAQFLPFSAINLFMRPDYRANVVKKALLTISTSSKTVRSQFDGMTKKFITVPGFRNSVQAPMVVKIKPFIGAFEKSPDVASFILKLWADNNPELRSRIYDLLVERHWEILPPDVDRTKLPGFITSWPEGENFDLLNSFYKEKYPNNNDDADDISLMLVWLSNRLPYD